MRSRSPVGTRYDVALDRESASEVLQKRAEKREEAVAREEAAAQEAKAAQAEKKKPAAKRSNRQSPTEAAIKSFMRSMSSMLGREIMRGILGAVKKGR